MTKKILSMALAIAMVMALSVSVFAAADGSITVSNATNGQEYTLYKIFDATLTADNAHVSYTIESNSPWIDEVKAATTMFSLELADADTYYVTAVDNLAGKDVATWAKAAIAADATITAVKSETAANGEAKFEGLEYGYYFIDSTLGSLCTVDTTMPNAEVQDKNAKPTLEKKVEGQDTYTAMMGEDVDFTLTVGVGSEVVTGLGTGIDADYEIVDNIPDGMTVIADSFKIANWTKDTDYTVTVSGQTVTIVLESAKLATLTPGSTFVIEYQAELDNDAVVAGDGNKNTAQLTYNNYKTAEVDAIVYTYAFDLVKTNGDKALLDGAEFTLYDAETEGSVVNVVKNGDKYQVDMDATASESIVVNGKVVVEGLANGTYWLEETKAPAGYNVLAARQKVEIKDGSLVSVTTDEAYTSGGVQVINNAGTELPSTGGIGTTIFYALGAVMVIGAGVLLVAKKRMSVEG